jgi:putative ABC transport system permease protein
MLKNYFKIAWRNIAKNKLFSAINIAGLSIGIACCAIISLYVSYELSYDTYNEQSANLYRLTTVAYEPDKVSHFAHTAPVIAERIKLNFPEVQDFVRLNQSQRTLSYENKKQFDTRIFYADSALLTLFSFGLLEGNEKALSSPYSIVLTETAAKKFFDGNKAFGKILKFSDSINLMVTGIIKDIPANSHLNADCFISRATLADMNKNNDDWKASEKEWLNCDTYSYVLLKPGSNPKVLQDKINAMLEKEMADFIKQAGIKSHVDIQLVSDIHLKSHLEDEFKGSVNGDIRYVYLFAAAALFILLIACCNFINLSTARSLNRSKEIGLRKVIGAGRRQLIFQFLGESVLFTLIASVLSLLIMLASIPLFNSLLGITLHFSMQLIWFYLAIILVVGLLAGLYPALMMSSFSPITSLKGKISHSIKDVVFRKGLVVFQFSVTIILIIGTSLILKQLDYLQNRDIGLNKEQVVSIKLKAADAGKASVVLKELLRNSNVIQGTLNNFSYKGVANITLLPEGFAENEMHSSYVISVDENFLPTYQIPVIAGRNFSKDFTTDEEHAFIVNEASVKAYGWKTPEEAIGKNITWAGSKQGKVIGVVKDFNFLSLHETIKPLLIHIFPPWANTISLRLKTSNLDNTLKQIESTWKGIATQSPFEYSFVDDDFDNLYHSERMMRNVLSAFTFLSILVACLGLLGLVSFTISQRVKEIGIRRVLGSGVGNIVRLLTQDFLKLVAIAFVIAVPVAWYGTSKWLQSYAYRTEIGIWSFVVAGLAAFIIAFLTVSIQALKAAYANPVKNLRAE